MAETEIRIISRKEAIASRLKRYFTGKSCKNGHVAERQTSNGVCVQCFSVIRRRYRKNNPEIVRELNRRYAAAHPEWKRQQDKTSYQRHRPKRIAKHKEYVRANRAAVLAWYREYKARNPEFAKVAKGIRRARLRKCGGKYTAHDLREIVKQQRSKCAYCRCVLGKKYHADHVIPLALGGTNDRRNIQALCQSCNLNKAAKDPIEFVRSIGMLL